MNRVIGVIALAVCTIVCGPNVYAVDDSQASSSCDNDVGLGMGSATCTHTADEVIALYNAGDGIRYKIHQQCLADTTDGVCFNPRECVSNGRPGTWFDLFRNDGTGWTAYGEVCLTAGDAGQLGAITPALVLVEMRKLAWPKSELVVQPPGGETLVNLATNFYTTNTAATSQVITLMGQRVEIEATPGSYVWHWAGGGESGSGEDAAPFVTTAAGGSYPDLEVTHTYRDADITVHPWVDTVYSGRYRVNGDAWVTIPQTLTVAGDPVALDILEARPQLVG